MESVKSEKVVTKDKRKLKNKKKRHSSSDSEISSQEEWVEAASTSTVQRDDWMNASSFVPTVTKEEIRGKKRKKELQPLSTIEKPGQHDRELNPYWKDGGIGLPTEDCSKMSSSYVSSSEKSVGDSGLNWLRRAYQRIEEQAKEENKSLEEVAAARWGSLEKLESLLREAEAKAKKNNYLLDVKDSRSWKTGSSYKKHKSRDEREYSRSKKPYEKSRTSYDKNNYSLFQQPSENSDVAVQQRRFCGIGEMEKPQTKRNWMKKETTYKPSTKSLENEKEETFEIHQTETKEPPRQCRILSSTEMNELGAKLIKAEMLGRKDQAEQLKLQLESARKAMENVASENFDNKTVLLFRTNDKGFSLPLSSTPESHADNSDKIKERKDKSRRKESWLSDNNKYSLKEMFEKEKMTTTADNDIEFAKLMAKSGPDDSDFDGYVANNIEEKLSVKQEKRDRNQAIHEHTKMSSAFDKCHYCLDSVHTNKHVIIAVGIKTYLTLPSVQSFTNGHCFIVPMSHTSAGTLLDEDVWAEIKIFCKGLTKMFEEVGKVAIFMETSMHHKRYPHTAIECIPVPNEEGNMAPFYFKKAIMESETEWSHNKKLVDLYKKDLLHSVPKGLPYFSVKFGLDGGFAHVIEDQKLFPSYFGKEIIGGLLEMEPHQWKRYTKENAEQQRKKTNEFKELWKPYDWTIKLKQR